MYIFNQLVAFYIILAEASMLITLHQNLKIRNYLEHTKTDN